MNKQQHVSSLAKSSAQSGFTLIEMIIVVVILAVLGAVSAPKFLDISKDADKAIMKAHLASLIAATGQVKLQVALHSDKFIGNRQNRFELSNGQVIRMRGGFPEGRWNNTFQYLVDFSSTDRITSNNCDSDTFDWCVRERNLGWFNREVLDTNESRGRGFLIVPTGYNINQSQCYVYYFNPNAVRPSDQSKEPIIGMDTSGC